MSAVMTSRCRWIGVIAAAAVLSGCAGGGSDLRRPAGTDLIPRQARVGLVEFRQCGAAYLDRLNPDYYRQDRTARFMLTCTELGYPRTFHDGLRQRLESRLGRKLVRVTTEKSFMPKVVLRDAEKLKLEYVIAGDLLAMGDTADESVVSAQLFALQVADRKLVLQGTVRKSGPKGSMQQVVENVADAVFAKAFGE